MSHTGQADEALLLANQQARAITALMERYLRTGSWEEAADGVLTAALEQTGATAGFIAVSVDGQTLQVEAHWGIAWDPAVAHPVTARPGASSRTLELEQLDNLPGGVFLQGGPLLIPGAQGSPPLTGGFSLEPLEGFLGVPLRKGNEALGVLAVVNRSGGFQPAHQGQLMALAHAASVLLDSHRRALREAQLKDQLRQSQKLEAVGRLAGGVAHDFNNLLTIVEGYATVLLDALAEPGPQREAAEQIRGAGQRGSRLTRQLLALSRKQVIHPQIVGLNHLVQQMTDLLLRLIGEHITVTTELAPDLWRVSADAAQIEQVIMNLVVNARDAMPDGGRLTIRTANVELDDSTGRLPQATELVSISGSFNRITGKLRRGRSGPGELRPFVQLSFTDTGCGMSEDIVKQLFEPFFTTKGPGKGTGLGLATVYGIVKQSSGHISVESKPDQGSTFSIFLPRVEDAGPAVALDPPPIVATPAVAPAAAPGIATILVVEDEDSLRGLIVLTLKKLGYHVLAAGRPGQAIELCTSYQGPIHLLLSDVVMPEMSGWKLSLLVKEQRPEIPVLFMSGYTQDVLGEQGVLAPGTRLIEKPFTTTQLAERVHGMLAPPKPGAGR